MATTKANINKAMRQENLREKLRAGGLVQHVLEISTKLSTLDKDLEALEIQRLKAAADIQLKLISKYLPDLKGIELSGADGNDLGGLFKVELVKSNDTKD